MREMKDSGVTWIGEIPARWGINRLKSFALTHFGGCWGDDAKGNENDVLCIRIADFDFFSQTVKESASTMRNYTQAQIEKGLLKDGDLIIEKSGGGDKTPVGRVVVYEKSRFPKAMFANFSECLRPKNIDNKFLAYQLKALYYSVDMHYYFNQTTGLQNLDMQTYLNAMMCFPTMEEQQKIAAHLDRKCTQIDALISNAQQQIEKLKAYKQSVITETVTKGLDPDVAMKDSGVEWIGEIPEHWTVAPIRSLFRIKKDIIGHEPDTVLSITQGGIKVKDINENSGQMANSYAHYQIVNIGDFAMNHMDLLTGGVGISEFEGVTSPDYRVFVIRNAEMNPRYFLYVFQMYYRNKIFYAFGQGAANLGRWRLPAQNFNTVAVPLSPVEEQNSIVTFLDEKCTQIDNLIALKQQKIEKLQQYKKSLIYEYVTGKKEV